MLTARGRDGRRTGRVRPGGDAELHRREPGARWDRRFFDQREVDVDVLVARLERATALIDEFDKRLRQTRAQVEELVPRLDALAAETTTEETTRSETRRH